MLRMKRFTCSFLLILLSSSILLLGGLYFLTQQTLRYQLAQRNHETHLMLQDGQGALNQQLQWVRAELSSLIISSEIRHLVNTPNAAHQAQAAQQFLFLLKRNPHFDQVRWIDQQGYERLRAQQSFSGPQLIAAEQLRNTAQQDYLRITQSTAPGAAFTFIANLNQAQQALKPVLQVLTPLSGDAGQRMGIVVIDIRVQDLLDVLLGKLQGVWGELMIINQAGYWVYHPHSALQRTPGLEHEPHFSENFSMHFPITWEELQKQLKLHSADTLNTSEGRFFFSTLELSNDHLIILSHVAPALLQPALWQHYRRTITLLSGVLILFSLLSAWLYSRLQQQRQLRQQEQELFSILFYYSADASLLVDSSGMISRANPQVERLFGYHSVDELIGLPIDILIPPQFREHHHTHFQRFLKQPRLRTMGQGQNLYGQHLSRGEFPIDVMLSPIHLQEGLMVLVSIRDVTERHRIEQQLRQISQAAIASNQAKSEFLANMSHEIRTPLNAITGFTELLRNQIHDAQQRHYVDGIKISSKNLLRLINDILDLSKIEAGRMQLVEKPTDVRSLCEEITQIFQTMAQQKGLEFILKMSADLPLQLNLDETRLRQVLLNLVGNAVKFTKTGSIQIQVYGNPDQDQQHYQLTLKISDTGIGIPFDQQQIIFESFNQASTEQPNPLGSTGLGLAITQRVINLMGGSILVDSEPGKGSIFRVRIPTEIVASAEEAPILEANNEMAAVSFHPARLLLAEDDSYNREIIHGLLQNYPLQIIDAENGEQALSICRNSTPLPDLILMDMRMPVLDGYNATRHLKNDPKLAKIPVIALTASSLENVEHSDILAICDGYLRKPVTADQLKAALMDYLPFRREVPTVQEHTETDGLNPDEALPEAMLQELREHIIPAYQHLKTIRSMKKIQTFARQLESLGKYHDVVWLSDYGHTLAAAVSGNRIRQINQLLTQFQAINDRVLGDSDSSSLSFVAKQASPPDSD